MADPLVTTEVHGLRQLDAGSVRLGREIGPVAGDAFRDVAQATAALVAARVPHRSGRLAGSVGAELDRSSDTASVGIGDGVPYAGWIEFGGGRYRGRPYTAEGRYLYPTARAAGRELQAAGERAAVGEIRRFHWQRPS